jgi:O-antigen/teichoic acid export membrane protein
MPTPKTRFGRDVLIAGAATFIRSCRNLLMLPLLTRCLSLAEFGLWEQLVAGVALVIPWVTLQLPGALIRFLPGQADQELLREGFFSVLFFTLFASGAFALSLWLLSPLLAPYPRLEPFLEHLGPVLLLVPLTGMLNAVGAYFRAFRLMVRHSLLTLGQSFGEIALVAYVFLAGQGLGEALAALALVRGLFLLAGVWLIACQLGWGWPRFSALGTYLRFSVPLIPNSSFYRLFDAGDRYVLGYFLGNAAVGVYTAAYTMGSAFSTLMAPLHFVLLPALAELWNTGNLDELGEYLSRTLRYSGMVLLPALAGICLFPGPILGLVVSQAYDQAALYLPVLSLSFLIYALGVPGNHLLVTAGHTRKLLAVNGVIVALNLGLNLLAIPLVGIWGAVLCTLLGHALYAGTLLFMAHRVVPYPLPWKALLLYAGDALGMAAFLKLGSSLYPLPILPTILAGALIYLALLCLTGGLTRAELRYLRGLANRRGGR